MTRGRSRKRYQTSRRSIDENVHSQTWQGEEIATPPAQCTSPRRGWPDEFIEMNPSNPLQSEEPEIGDDSFYAASAVSPNASHQDKHLLCSPLTAFPNHYLMLHRHWRIHILRNQRANNHFLIVLHRFGTNMYVFMLGDWKGIVMKLIIPLLWQQFNILRKNMRRMNFPLTLKAKMMTAFLSIRSLQRPPSRRPRWLDFERKIN